MRNVTITVDGFGRAITDSAQLGFSGEHNAAQLTVLFDSDAVDVYSQIEFFRIVIDGMYSDKLYRNDGEICYTVPQCCMKPPAVHCQLVGYKSTDGEPEVIIKSEVVTLNVERSEVSLYPEDTDPSLIERAMERCDNAAETAVLNANRAEAAVSSAMSAADRACKSADLSVEGARQAGQHAESASKSAEVLEKAVYDYRNVANALRRTTRGKRGTLKDVSPLEHEVKVQMTADDMSIFGFGDTLKTAEFTKKGDTVMLDTPSDSVHVVLESGHIYDVSGVIPLVDGQDLTALTDFSELAITPLYGYGESFTKIDLTYTITDKVLSWVRVETLPAVPDAEPVTLSGSYALESSGQKIIGFCQVYELDESNPNFQNPEYDTLYIKAEVYDTSPPDITLTVGGKNLFNLEGRQLVNFGAQANTTKRKFYGGKAIILRYARSNHYYPTTTDEYTVTKNSVSYKIKQDWYGIGFDVKLSPNTQYKFSRNESAGSVYLVEFDSEGKYIKNTSIISNAVTTTSTTDWGVICFTGSVGADIIATDPQLELGSTATEYEPYTESATYIPEADGTVKGVKSIYPSMRFETNSSDVWLDIEYNRDLVKVINNLENAIIATGGNL